MFAYFFFHDSHFPEVDNDRHDICRQNVPPQLVSELAPEDIELEGESDLKGKSENLNQV